MSMIEITNIIPARGGCGRASCKVAKRLGLSIEGCFRDQVHIVQDSLRQAEDYRVDLSRDLIARYATCQNNRRVVVVEAVRRQTI